MYTPMVSDEGKVAIEGLTLRLAENEYLFTQSGGAEMASSSSADRHQSRVEDVTPDYTCYALQGPRSTDVLEALTARKA